MSVTRRAILFALGAGAGVTFSPLAWKLTDDISIWTQNWPWIPRLQYGPIGEKPALSKLIQSGAPIKVATAGERPITVKGNPDNPLSKGSIPSLPASEVQMLYKPARVQGPLKKSGEGFESISWDEAEKLLADRMRKAGASTAMISGDETGTANEVFSSVVRGLGSDDYYVMPSEHHLAAVAWHRHMGGRGHPGFDIDNADHVLFLGPDALECWGTPTRTASAFESSHPTAHKPTAAWAYCGPVKNRTASVCDAYHPAPPGAEAAVAMGIAYHLMEMGRSVDAPDFGAFRSLVMSKFTPSQVERSTGVSADTLKKAAQSLARARRPLVVMGSVTGQGGEPAAFVAGMAVNLLLGNLGKPGGLRPVPEQPAVVPGGMTRSELMATDVVAWLKRVGKGEKPAPELLLVYEANPRYALPEAEAMGEALDKAGFTVSFSSFMDETAAKADLILPNPMSLERQDDLMTPYGSAFASYTLGRPVTAPVKDAKPTTDLFLSLAGKLGQNPGFKDFAAVLAGRAESLGAMGGYISGGKDPAEAIMAGSQPSGGDLAKGLEAGRAWLHTAPVAQTGLSLATDVLAEGAAYTKPSGGSLALAPQKHLNVGTGSMAIPGFNLPTLRDEELQNGKMAVFMCSETAKLAGVTKGDPVTLSNDAGSVSGYALIDETVMPGVVSAPLGFGHTHWDEFSAGRGDNVNKVLTVSEANGLTSWNRVSVKVAKS
ncbi:menaquinone reductase molybdopterin-binding-like subunit QrcB [Desulfohalovibrio reitneri]|uniref:menaquinone reductase molybdopterin-binding-like subunit QrcB n=1 Tax=Desulfohalovibrio reitneri TaxID=1307759 RepID=UPI0004A769FD|nr:menaquinone reductase molybdopterin-binding-like subunit QrcB [Desulfohalovibrio reitneri]